MGPDFAENYETVVNPLRSWLHADNCISVGMIEIRFLTKGEYFCDWL